MVYGQLKRSRQERDREPNANGYQYNRSDNREPTRLHHTSRHQRHTSLPSAHEAEGKDQDLETQVEQLQVSLHIR